MKRNTNTQAAQPPARCVLHWRLPEMMARAGVRSASELKRRLESVGVDLSTNQVARVVKEVPERLNLDLLEGLCTVLACRPDDLLGPEFAAEPPPDRPSPDEPPPAATTDRPALGARAARKLKIVTGKKPVASAATTAPSPSMPRFVPYPPGHKLKPTADG